jgi:hypothetical protein
MPRLSCHRFLPGEPVAAAGTAGGDRQVSLTSLQQRYWSLLTESHLMLRSWRRAAQRFVIGKRARHLVMTAAGLMNARVRTEVENNADPARCLSPS